MTDTPLTAEACEECLDRRWGSVHGETCPHHPLSPWESTQRHIAALTERAKTAELESTWQQENDRLRERIRVADARVAALEAALTEQGLLQKTASGSMVWHAHDCPASFDFGECNYRCRVAREAFALAGTEPYVSAETRRDTEAYE